LRNGGPLLAAIVLVVEAAKGYGAVWIGFALVGDLGAVVAGAAAVAGNVYNLWYRFQGGKGLGISLGVLAAVWPTVIPVVVVVIVVAVIATRSSGAAALAAMAGLILSAVMWEVNDWPTGGVAADPPVMPLAPTMTLVMFEKHWRDARFRGPARRARRRRASPDHR
jgi:glycerol-3-phosphate acyltransferase PlsY